MQSRFEFIAMMAMLFATVAFSIDSMLPALPEIGQELSPDAPNRAQLILSAFVMGLGAGTFIVGPISDAIGRKPMILFGAGIYMVGALLASMAQTLELMLLARALQGLGAAGPRVVGMAVTRDLYSGRQMAQISSFVMFIFVLFPAVAPLLGSGIIELGGWRAIFLSFILFSIIGTVWMQLRLSETLPKAARCPFRPAPLAVAAREVFAHPSVRITIVVLTLCFAMFFAMLSSVQQIYDITFARADSFPYWFFAISLVASGASIVNAKLVVRLGMRFLVTVILGVQVVVAGAVVVLSHAGLSNEALFVVFLVWQAVMFFQMGLTMGNLNAMGMEPLGHIAGMAASIIGGVSTVAAMLLAAPIGLAFDGTIVPLSSGVLILSVLAMGLMLWLRRVEARLEATAY